MGRTNSYEYTVTPSDLQKEQNAFIPGPGVSYNLINYGTYVYVYFI